MARRLPGWLQARAPADASDGPGDGIPATKTDGGAPGTQEVPVPVAELRIDRPNQAWASDITHIPMPRGFMYLVAVMDWYSRKVLSWRLSDTPEADFCVEALEEALAQYGKPEIFNTDQGCQFTNWSSEAC